jgi:hypothetical protein
MTSNQERGKLERMLEEMKEKAEISKLEEESSQTLNETKKSSTSKTKQKPHETDFIKRHKGFLYILLGACIFYGVIYAQRNNNQNPVSTTSIQQPLKEPTMIYLADFKFEDGTTGTLATLYKDDWQSWHEFGYSNFRSENGAGKKVYVEDCVGGGHKRYTSDLATWEKWKKQNQEDFEMRKKTVGDNARDITVFSEEILK